MLYSVLFVCRYKAYSNERLPCVIQNSLEQQLKYLFHGKISIIGCKQLDLTRFVLLQNPNKSFFLLDLELLFSSANRI